MRVLLSLVGVACATSACNSSLDCSLNGACDQGVCVCDRAWAGAACERLVLQPARLTDGYNLLASDGISSWGATQLKGDDGLYHTFVGEVAGHCGLSSFLSNQQTVHAVSESPLGPWKRMGPLHPFGIQSECPHVQRANDGTWLVFHTGCGNHSDSHSNPIPIREDCINGSTPEFAQLSFAEVPTCGPGAEITSVFTSHSPYGPWEQKLITLPSREINGVPWPPSVSRSRLGRRNGNPSAVVLPNGTTLLMFRSEYKTDDDCTAVGGILTETYRPGCTLIGIARAPEWWGPYEVVGGPIIPFQQEDPHLYYTSRGFHVIFHGMDPYLSKKGVGRHAFSEDGLSWHYLGGGKDVETAFSATVELDGGGTIDLERRERPELLFDEDGEIVGLVSGVVPGWQGDQSFTMAQAVGPRPSVV